MNRESGIFRNEFVRNDSCKNWGNLQKFISGDPDPPAHAPASVLSNANNDAIEHARADNSARQLNNETSFPPHIRTRNRRRAAIMKHTMAD